MKQNIEFIKKLRRVEIKEAVENLRTCNKQYEEAKRTAGQMGYPTVASYDYALVAELTAAQNKVSRLFKARNDFEILQEAM